MPELLFWVELSNPKNRADQAPTASHLSLIKEYRGILEGSEITK